MSTTYYVVDVETRAGADEAVAERWVEELAPWHGVVSERAGHLSVTVTLPAEDLGQASATALLVVGRLAQPLTVHAQPEEIRDARQGWEPIPALLSVAQAAEQLGVSRQRALQMIDEGKLPATRIGKVYGIASAAVDQAARHAPSA